MTASDAISVVGAVVTIVCTLISIHQARAAKRYGDALKAAKTRIGLLTLAERLRAAQDAIAQLPQAPSALRGSRPDVNIPRIRVEFDRTLGSLERNGPAATARGFLEQAQANLDRYEDSVRMIGPGPVMGSLDVVAMRSVRTAVQDAIAEIVEVAERIDP
ncbi:hypothetical protein [Methylobacterium bullatum]|uniref:hypothetical protein n=1 Tax=Methylobacterium bullatum TaxID=570505 RepID=UPI0030D239AA